MNVASRIGDLRWMTLNCNKCDGTGMTWVVGKAYPYSAHGQMPPDIPRDTVCEACVMLRGELAALQSMQVIPA